MKLNIAQILKKLQKPNGKGSEVNLPAGDVHSHWSPQAPPNSPRGVEESPGSAS